MAEKLKCILLIDDDPLIQRLFGGRLSKLGYNTLYAHNGVEGREMARRMKPDLILMDMHMPGDEDGMKTAIRLRQEGELGETPISMLTAEDLSLDVERTLKQAYKIEYMHKGIEEKDFIEKIQVLLGLTVS
jgi:CheY-like chemotaxis protein